MKFRITNVTNTDTQLYSYAIVKMLRKVKRKRNYTQIKKIYQKDIAQKDLNPGDGNCFYHALLQQLQRSDIAIDYHSSQLNLNPLPSHLELRSAILRVCLTTSE